MFTIHCNRCHTKYIVSTRAMSLLENTPDGPVAHLTCPAGHQQVRYFHGAPLTRTA